MNEVLELLRRLDLNRTGQSLWEVIDTNPLIITAILGVLILVGAKMATSYPHLRSWGLRVAAAVFLLHVGFTSYTDGLQSDDWGWTLLRSANVAGFVLAPLWLIFPIVLFVYSRLRLVIATFLIYSGYAWFVTAHQNTDQLPHIALESSIAAALALVVAWIIQPITDYVFKHMLPKAKPTSAPNASTVATPVPSQEVEQAWRLREAATELLHLKNTQLRQETEQLSEQHRRRQRARLKAELCYTLNEPALATAFPRSMFEDFMSRYLHDQVDPDTAEENAKELEGMIQRFVTQQPVTVQPVNLSDLTQWFVEEQHRIQHDERDHDQKKTKLAGLTRRYSQLAERLIEEEVN